MTARMAQRQTGASAHGGPPQPAADQSFMRRGTENHVAHRLLIALLEREPSFLKTGAEANFSTKFILVNKGHKRIFLKPADLMAPHTSSPLAVSSEQVDIEFKSWPVLPCAGSPALRDPAQVVDDATRFGIHEVVRTCAALYNNDGGELHLGRENATGHPVGRKSEAEVRAQYSSDDVIIPLLSTFLIPVPPIRSAIVDDRGLFWLRIQVFSGVTLPAALREEISWDKIRYGRGSIFVRETGSNGKPSTGVLRNEADWFRLMNRCIKNRGADVIGPAFMEVGTLINRCDPFNLGKNDSYRGNDSIDATAHQIRCIADALGQLDFDEVCRDLKEVAGRMEACLETWRAHENRKIPGTLDPEFATTHKDEIETSKRGWVKVFKRIIVDHRGSRFSPKS